MQVLQGFDLNVLMAVIGATGAFGLASMSLVDACKAIPDGGISRIGFKHIKAVLDQLSDILKEAVGEDWPKVFLAHWVNGRSRREQIGAVRSVLRLGITADISKSPDFGGVKAADLSAVGKKLAAGQPLSEAEVNLIGRFEAAVEARLDAAFDLADQEYRNRSRVLAGAFAVLLAIVAWLAVSLPSSGEISELFSWTYGKTFIGAVLLGLFAVPIAPIAKDLVSALASASKALQSAKNP